MSVALDANATAPTSTLAGNSLTNGNLTIGSGANALVVQLWVAGTTISVTGVVWDQAGANQAMTLIGSQVNLGGNGFVQLWGLVAPVSGNKIITASWTGTTSTAGLNGTSFSGVETAGGTSSFARFNGVTGTSTAPNVGVSSNVGNIVGDALATGPNVTTPVANSTQLFSADLSASFDFASQYQIATNGVNSMSWTLAASMGWDIVACDVVASVSPAPMGAESASGGIVGRNYWRT